MRYISSMPYMALHLVEKSTPSPFSSSSPIPMHTLPTSTFMMSGWPPPFLPPFLPFLSFSSRFFAFSSRFLASRSSRSLRVSSRFFAFFSSRFFARLVLRFQPFFSAGPALPTPSRPQRRARSARSRQAAAPGCARLLPFAGRGAAFVPASAPQRCPAIGFFSRYLDQNFAVGPQTAVWRRWQPEPGAGFAAQAASEADL